jgi:hypothetical protein
MASWWMVGAGVVALLLAAVAGAAPVGLPGSGDLVQGDCRTVEDFARGRAGEFPPDWRARKDAGRKVYAVQEEMGLRFLRGVAREVGVQAGKEIDWDLAAYPVLAWAWRPRQFPAGADERTARNDSALAVYAVFPHSPVAVRSLKYIWSEVVPAGTWLAGSQGMTQVRVLRTGPAGDSAWVEERANVAEDYRRAFGDGALPRPAGIAVLTDADDTRSTASGDYARFRICRG